MNLTQKFNYDEFVRGFRAACERRGVDPARGATGYQVVNAVVDRRRAVRKWSRLPQRHWWQNPDLWLNCPPYRSETEQQAVWNLFTETQESTGAVCLAGQCLRDLRRELALRIVAKEIGEL